MSELLSVVVVVRPEVDVSVAGHLGRAVYAQFMRWADYDDAALAQRWHDSNGLKPFTCSTLVGGRRYAANSRVLSREQEYWFRITALDAESCAVLRARLEKPPRSVDLDDVILPVVKITADASEHEWAGSSHYEALSAPYLLAQKEPPRRVQLRFTSPVAFHQDGEDMPIPQPDLVFGSLVDRWNAFSAVGLSPEMRAFCKSGVGLSNFHLHSQALPLKAGGQHLGAVGEVAYYIRRYDRYWMSALRVLADYAFYAGVGRLTTQGMGQTQVL